MSSDEFEFESIQDPQTIRRLIVSLMDGLDKGRIVLSSNGDEIVMSPSNLLKFSVHARKKGETGKINLKLSWKERKADAGGSGDKIAISS